MKHIEQHSPDYYTNENAAIRVLLTGTFLAYASVFTLGFYLQNYFAVTLFAVEAALTCVAVFVAKKYL